MTQLLPQLVTQQLVGGEECMSVLSAVSCVSSHVVVAQVPAAAAVVSSLPAVWRLQLLATRTEPERVTGPAAERKR